MRSHVSLADRLFAMALSIESGCGEAFVLMQSAERLDAHESRIRDLQQCALYLRTTLADVSALLAGERSCPSADRLAEASIKASAAVRVAEKFDLEVGG